MSKEIEAAAIAFAESKTQDLRAKCLIAGGFTAGAEWARQNPPKCETCEWSQHRMCQTLADLVLMGRNKDVLVKNFGCIHHKPKGE